MKGNKPQQQYYAVYVPNLTFGSNGDNSEPNSFKSSNLGVICDTLQEAKTLAKKYEQCDARFKIFNNLKEAKAYVNGQSLATPAKKKSALQILSPPPGVSPLDGEKPAPFPSVPRAELNLFRKALESSDNEFAYEKIIANPRYLINYSNDTPTILFEGCRYNALHIASKFNNFPACKLITELFSDGDFLSRLYPDDSESKYRAEFLLDRYLNTPDKSLNQTPLHFAAKEGYLDIVKLFMSFPVCQKDCRNKYGETPADLAQSRCAEAFTAKPSLKLCLDDEAAYVPMYRTTDYSTAPILKPPCLGFPMAILSDELGLPGRAAPSPVNSSAYLAALAGPTTFFKAKQIHSEWSSHKIEIRNVVSNDKKRFLSVPGVKRLDLHKGMERLGRNLADKYNVEWAENWSFLSRLCDVRSSEGLRWLENYFASKITNKRKLSFDELFTKIKAISPTPPIDSVRSKIDFSSSTPLRLRAADKSAHLSESVAPKALFHDREEVENFYDSFDDIQNLEIDLDSKRNLESDKDCEIADEDFSTPPETPPTVYISGDHPTKVDFDVFISLENVEFDKSLYPNVNRWFDRVSAQKDREKWPAFDSPRIKRNCLSKE